MKGTSRRILVAGGVLVLIVAGFLGYAWTREPLGATPIGLGTNDAPKVHGQRVHYAPGGEVYVALLLENRGRLPVEIVGLVAEDPGTPAGYYAAEIRAALGVDAALTRTQAFHPVTLGGGAATRVVVVYRAAPCEALQVEEATDAFTMFLSVAVRIRILGVLPTTQVLETGRMFSVPFPSGADC